MGGLVNQPRHWHTTPRAVTWVPLGEGCLMTGLIFLAAAIAMMVALAGYRGLAIGLFGVSFVAAALLFDSHLTQPLGLAL